MSSLLASATPTFQRPTTYWTRWTGARAKPRITDIREWLDTTRPQPDDVLFLYYSGPGKASGTHPDEEYIALQDGLLYASELRRDVQGAPACRLKLLVTDRCEDIVDIREELHAHAPADTRKIDSLFRKHRGVLHLTSATGKEFGWADAREGGLLTLAFLHAIDSDVHASTWKDLFRDIKETTEALFQAASPNLSVYKKALMKEKGIARQTPNAYTLPTQTDSDTPRDAETLWTFTNPDSPFALQAGPGKKAYERYEYITLGIELEQDAYVVILNRAADGAFKCLFPNMHQVDNWLSAGQHLIPNQRSAFDIKISHLGTEKVKILALRAREDNDEIVRLFRSKDAGVFGRERRALEEDILRMLQKIDTHDWDEAHFDIRVHDVER